MADDVEMTPITPDEGASIPPKVAPFAGGTGAATIKLKPVIRKPMIHKPTIGAKPMIKPVAPAAAPAVAPAAAPAAAPAPLTPAAPAAEATKKSTQNLKSVTGPIPAQATLKKTGIIAEGIITPQQQQAAKSKTSRISLESAIGVVPAKEAPAPLKTIRLRRPTDLKPAGPAPLIPKAAEPQNAEAPVAELPADDASVTQKKTLKLQRPSPVGLKRPGLGINKAAADQGAAGEVADLNAGAVADIPTLTPLEMGRVQSAADEGGLPKWLMAISLAVSVAALIVVGLLVFNLVEEGRHATGAGANEMAFLDF